MDFLKPCRRFFFTVLLYIIATVSSAQSNPFLHYSVSEGLPSSEVYNVHQDKKGFIWFATDNGVVRYDGKNMELFQTNNGLSDPVVFELIEDAKERLWFRTFSGRISYFFNEKIYPYQFSDSLANLSRPSYVQSLYSDSTGHVWFGATRILGNIADDGKVYKETTNLGELALKKVEGNLMYSRKGAASQIKKIIIDGRKVDFHLPDTLHNHSIVCPIRWNGRYYFSIGAFIFKVNQTSVDQVFHAKDQIIDLSIDNQNNLWIGYLHQGAECYYDFQSKKELRLDFISSKSVTCILQDQQGGYWFSTLQEGVYYVPDITFSSFDLPVESKVKTVGSWGNNTAIGEDNGLLLILDKTANIVNSKKLKDNIVSIIEGAKNTLWVSTSSETFIFDQSLQTIKTIPFSSSQFCRDEGSIWGVSAARIKQFDLDGNQLKEINTDSNVRSIFVNNDFIFLVGRIGMEVRSRDDKKIRLPALFESLKVTKILTLNDSLLVLGTLGSGFYLVDQRTWKNQQYFSKNRFIANNIYSLLIVGSNLWIGTENGMAITSIESLLLNNPEFSFISKKNGAISDKINHLTYNGHRVWAFAENSFCTIPEKVKLYSDAKFYLQNVLINNKPTTLHDQAQFGYDQNHVQLDFKFVDLRNQNVFIRSRLAPSEEWSYSQERSIRFFSLRSGRHNLEIEYSTDNIHWNKGITWAFTISPPWWRTWYFQMLAILILTALAALYFKRRVALVNERNSYLNLINAQQGNLIRAELETLERERNRIAKDLHDSVGTNLTAIKMMVSNILKKYNDPKSAAIEKEFQNTIQDIKGIIHELVPAGLDKYGLSETVRTYAAKIEESLNLKIEVNSFGPELKDNKLSLLSFRILQELLSNTLKHSRASKVVIHINSFDDLLSILYQDNGTGFEIEKVKKGSGLMNIQSRVQTANGNLKFESGNFGVSYIIDVPINSL